jgi:hypothetical protein
MTCVERLGVPSVAAASRRAGRSPSCPRRSLQRKDGDMTNARASSDWRRARLSALHLALMQDHRLMLFCEDPRRELSSAQEFLRQREVASVFPSSFCSSASGSRRVLRRNASTANAAVPHSRSQIGEGGRPPPAHKACPCLREGRRRREQLVPKWTYQLICDIQRLSLPIGLRFRFRFRPAKALVSYLCRDSSRWFFSVTLGCTTNEDSPSAPCWMASPALRQG